MGGDLPWGGEHTVQCTDDVLWNCAPETCIMSVNQCHHDKFNAKEKIVIKKKHLFLNIEVLLNNLIYDYSCLRNDLIYVYIAKSLPQFS